MIERKVYFEFVFIMGVFQNIMGGSSFDPNLFKMHISRDEEQAR